MKKIEQPNASVLDTTVHFQLYTSVKTVSIYIFGVYVYDLKKYLYYYLIVLHY